MRKVTGLFRLDKSAYKERFREVLQSLGCETVFSNPELADAFKEMSFTNSVLPYIHRLLLKGVKPIDALEEDTPVYSTKNR